MNPRGGVAEASVGKGERGVKDETNQHDGPARPAPFDAAQFEPLFAFLQEGARRPEVRAALTHLLGALRALVEQGAATADGASQQSTGTAATGDGPRPQPAQPPAAHAPRRRVTLWGEPLEVPDLGADEGGGEQFARPPAAPSPSAAAPASRGVARGEPGGRERAAPAAQHNEESLRLIVRSARLKAECCLWAIERRRRLREHAPFETAIQPTDEALLGRVRELPNCYVWMLDPYRTLPPDGELEQLANNYGNLAAAAEYVSEVYASREADRDELRGAYEVLAEAQSALRVGLERAVDLRDGDQDAAFHWLDTRTYEDRIYIERHMRLNDAADPAEWLDLQERIARLRAAREDARRAVRERRNLLNEARYKGRQILEGRALNPEYDWGKLAHVLNELVLRGEPPSSIELREIVLPILDQLPDDLDLAQHEGFLRVLREVDAFLASRGSQAAAPPAATSPETQRVAKLLAGRVVLLIGGEQQPEAVARLERQLGLRELRWIQTTPHQPLDGFEPLVARPEVALVLLMIRWTSHSFSYIRSLCERYGKPFVRLPGGYGTNQIAHQILKQVGRQLESIYGAD